MTTSTTGGTSHLDIPSGNSSGSEKRQKNVILLEPKEIQKSLTQLAAQWSSRITLDTVRPLHQFLGISGGNGVSIAGAFSSPTTHCFDKTTVEKVRRRFTVNFQYFASNYVMVAFGTLVVVALLHPAMLLSVGLLWALWSLHLTLVRRNDNVPLLQLSETTQIDLGRCLPSAFRRSLFLTITTIVVAIWQCLVPMLMVVGVSGVLIVLHAFFRDIKHLDTGGGGSGSTGAGSLSSPPYSSPRSGTDAEEDAVLVEKGDII